MNVVGKVSSLITQGMSSVATPFHPFGGAVDIIMVKQHDGTYKSTPWYVRFGKFQGVLKGAEKVVRIEVNGVEANFHMYLDNSGEAYFVREVDPGKDDDEDSKDKDNLEVRTEDNSTEYSNIDNELTGDELNDGEVEVRDERSTIGMDRLERVESDGHIFYEFQDDESFMDDSLDFPEYGSSGHENLDNAGHALESQDSTEVVLVSVDGHVLTAPIKSSERNSEDVQSSTDEGIEECKKEEDMSKSDNLNDLDASEGKAIAEEICETNSGPLPSEHQLETEPATLVSTDKDKEISVDSVSESKSNSLKKDEVFQSCLELSELALQSKTGDQENMGSSVESLEATECPQERSQDSLTKEETENGNNALLRSDTEVSPHDSGLKVEDGTNDLGLDQPHKQPDVAPVTDDKPQQKEDGSGMSSTQSGRWGIWPLRFSRQNTLEMSDSSKEEIFVDSLSVSFRKPVVTTPTARTVTDSPRKQILRTNVPTTDQIASLNLKEGQNTVNFVFSTKVLGSQKVEAHIYLWKWNTRIVISDVDGTITKSDVLGQFMPLVGKDWTHTGIARLLSAIKENGYQLLYLSARAIVQAYLTKSFLFNVKQDGKSIPDGPVVISPDGLFPSLYREVIRRAPHEFKIACLEDIKALFPPDYNPFYAGFGNRDTDELSYRKMGIPKGKIFIINPKGEVAINHRIDVKSYTSLHTLVDDMFPPPTSMDEQEDFNSWNYWKMPLPEVDDL